MICTERDSKVGRWVGLKAAENRLEQRGALYPEVIQPPSVPIDFRHFELAHRPTFESRSVYLDNASTSFPKPASVGGKILEYLYSYGVSPHRGGYDLSEKAEELVDHTRHQIAKLLSIETPEKIAFTQNATHGLNAVIRGAVNQNDMVVHCTSCHNSVLRPLHHLKNEKQIKYEPFTIYEDGQFDSETLIFLLKKRPTLLIVNHVSNVTGVPVHLKQILYLAKNYQVPVLLDCTQSLGYFDLKEHIEDVDFIVGTGHKTLLGPSGVGFLYVKNSHKVRSLIQGGSGGNVSLSPYHPNLMPHKFEAGTLNTTAIAGLSGALSYLESQDFSMLNKKKSHLIARCQEGLLERRGVKVYGCLDPKDKAPIVSFTMEPYLPGEISYILNHRFKICVRSGLHCAPLMHQVLKTYPTGTVRVSLGIFTVEDDIEIFLEAMRELESKK